MLANGLRYAVMRNATPKGAVSIRMAIDVGSYEERADERGVAHFLEHMAFRNTRSFPAEALNRTFAPAGVAFGRDHNAVTVLYSTTYMLDLPAAEPKSLDLAFRWLREVGDGVEFRPEAVDQERQVILAEREAGLSSTQEGRDAVRRFLSGDARSADRDPIGTLASLHRIDAGMLKAFYSRWYRPENAVVVVVGDLPIDELETRVKTAFSSWSNPTPAPVRAPTAKPDMSRGIEVLTRTDPAAIPVLASCRVGPGETPPMRDLAALRHDVTRRIWLSVLNERLKHAALAADAPYVAARVEADDDARELRKTCLEVTPLQGQWTRGLAAAQAEVARFGAQPLTEDELDQAIVELRGYVRAAASRGDTRDTPDLAGDIATRLLEHGIVVTPREAFRSFDMVVETLTPSDIAAAFTHDWSGAGPLLVSIGHEPIPAEALRTAWRMPQTQVANAAPVQAKEPVWAYPSFGKPGHVVHREAISTPDFVRLTFDNGVIVNFKPTKFKADAVDVRVRFGSGRRGLAKGQYPTMVFASSFLQAGGLGRHDVGELQTLFRTTSWRADLRVEDDAFVLVGDTTAIGLDKQLQILTAFVSDPGFRPTIDARLPTIIDAGYRAFHASPKLVVEEAVQRSFAPDNLALPPLETISKLKTADFERLIRTPLTTSPLEITIVGDSDEATVIDIVGRTFAALPARKATAVPRDAGVWLRFPDQPPPEIRLHHDGDAEKAAAAAVWPLYVATPARRREELTLKLIVRLMQNDVYTHVRQELGVSYAPSVTSSTPDFGDQGDIVAIVETSPKDVERAVVALRQSAERIAHGSFTAEDVEIARKPLLARLAQLRQDNGWWADMLDGSVDTPEGASEPMTYPDIYAALTLDEIRAVAARWLSKPPIVVVVTPKSDAGTATANQGSGK